MFTKTKFLTSYALSCGYVECDGATGFKARLGKEHGLYIVSSSEPHIQETRTESLTKARKQFMRVLRRAKVSRKMPSYGDLMNNTNTN